MPTASSTSELVYGILPPEKVTMEIAEALYMGIAHDTGVFQYSCTSPETMRIAGKLMKTGIHFSEIVDSTFTRRPMYRIRFWAEHFWRALWFWMANVSSVPLNRRRWIFTVWVPWIWGIVSQLRNTKGVEVAIFMYESKVQEFKVSMRSNAGVDVSKIASYFGGGGHTRAAGCTMQGSFYDVVNNLTRHIEKQIIQLDERA